MRTLSCIAILCALLPLALPPAAHAQEQAPRPAAPDTPAREIAFTVRLDALGYAGAYDAAPYGYGGLTSPKIKAGVYTEPFAARLILGYSYLSETRTSQSPQMSGSSEERRHVFALGAEAAYYLTPIARAAIATSLVARGLKLFMTDGSMNQSYSPTSRLLLAVGLGAEWCFTERFTVGLEAGVQATTGSGNAGSGDRFVVDLPYGLLTASMYLP